MITCEELRKLLNYNPETGMFTWLVPTSNRVKVLDTAGSPSNGYIVLRVKGRNYRAHRLVWLYVYGRWPTSLIDHINGVRNDNRLANLREATNAENMVNIGKQRNNTSGFKGVSLHKASGKWSAYCKINYKKHHLGLFNTPEEASAEYQAFAKEHHGKFYHTIKEVNHV